MQPNPLTPFTAARGTSESELDSEDTSTGVVDFLFLYNMNYWLMIILLPLFIHFTFNKMNC
jgi:hypothetical protein